MYPPSEALKPVAPTDKPVAMLLLLEPNKTRNTRVKALDIWSLGIACCGSWTISLFSPDQNQGNVACCYFWNFREEMSQWKQSLNAGPCLNSGFGFVYRQNSNNVLKELWSLSSIALLRILLQKCLGLKWQKRLSSPSIKLDKLHKDYPKSAATQLLQWKSHTTKRRSWNTRTRLTWGIATLLAKS